MGRFLAAFLRRLLLLLMAAGAATITAASVVYFRSGVVPPFVLEKLPDVHFPALWRGSLEVHVAAALVSFPLCILLMTRTVQRRAGIHRWIGRGAGTLVLFVLVPSGAILALEAKGGAWASAGFLFSGALVAWFMVKGVLAACRRDLAAHRRAMFHVFGQMSVAVTSRALLVALDVAGISPEDAYLVALWGPVLGSAVFAELFSGSLQRKIHGLEEVVRSLRPRSVDRPLARAGR